MMLAASLLVGALAPASRANDTARCGVPGKPACPLQRWMRQHMAAPLALGEHARLAEAFRLLERLNPAPGEWSEWQSLARRGQLAASDGEA